MVGLSLLCKIYGQNNEETMLNILKMLLLGSQFMYCTTEQLVIEMNTAPPPTLYPDCCLMHLET